jgi:hypothetical protein
MKGTCITDHHECVLLFTPKNAAYSCCFNKAQTDCNFTERWIMSYIIHLLEVVHWVMRCVQAWLKVCPSHPPVNIVLYNVDLGGGGVIPATSVQSSELLNYMYSNTVPVMLPDGWRNRCSSHSREHYGVIPLNHNFSVRLIQAQWLLQPSGRAYSPYRVTWHKFEKC